MTSVNDVEPTTDNLLRAKVILLVVFTVIAYYPLTDAGFIWDDDSYVTQNLTLRSMDGLIAIWNNPDATPQYYPLVHTSFWVEFQLWELNPLGYHIVNLLLHLASAFLLWRILALLKIPGAWLAALLFAIHPIQVESVAWITERKNVLSLFFYLASALFCLPVFGLTGRAVSTRRATLLLLLGLLFFVCALFSKTVAASLPAAILLLVWLKRQRIAVNDVLRLIPFFAIGIMLGLNTAAMEKSTVGAMGADWDFTFIERCIIYGKVLWFYPTKLVWPVELTFIYPRWQIDASDWTQWLPIVFVGLVLAGFVLGRRKLGDGPLVALLLYAGTLLPASGFFDVYPMRFSFVADHFSYHALLALFAVLGVVLVKIGETLPDIAMKTGTALIAIVLTGLTFLQVCIYETAETVWIDTLRKNPAATIAAYSLANIRQQQGKPANAMAILLHIQQWDSVSPLPDVNMAAHWFRAGRPNNGVAHQYRASAHFIQDEPERGATHYILCQSAIKQRNYLAAIRHGSVAVRCRPWHAGSYAKLAEAYKHVGLIPKAILTQSTAVDLSPYDPTIQYDFGLLLVQGRDRVLAKRTFETVLKLEPDHAGAMSKLAVLHLMQGETAMAITLLKRAEAIEPSINNKINLALAYRDFGDRDQAMHAINAAREAAKAAKHEAALQRIAEVVVTIKKALPLDEPKPANR